MTNQCMNKEITNISTSDELTSQLGRLQAAQVLLSLSHSADAAQLDDENIFSDKPAHDGSGILGYVSNVFSADGTSAPPEEPSSVSRLVIFVIDPISCAQVKTPDCRCLHEAIAVLYAIWEQLATPLGSRWGSQEESLQLIFTRTRTRCRRVLEHLFREYSLEVMESVVDCWSRGSSVSLSRTRTARA